MGWDLNGNSATNPPADFLGTRDDKPLVIKTGSKGEERLRVDAGGNVGIGTTTPTKPLDVAGSGGIRVSQTAAASAVNELYFADNGQIRSLDDNHRIIFNRTANDLELREFGTITLSPGATKGQRTAGVVIDSTGNVGIGRTNPPHKLDIIGDLRISGCIGVYTDAGGGHGESGTYLTITPDASGDVHFRPSQVNSGGGVRQSDLVLHGHLRIKEGHDLYLENADLAEDFDVIRSNDVEPGTVMVLAGYGSLQESSEPYDKRVAGVVSGAGEYKPGIVLDKKSDRPERRSIALTGKVYCKVDADCSPVQIGDLLTTSSTPGHAMKAVDSVKAFGAVIGKALAPLKCGCGMIPILVALQ